MTTTNTISTFFTNRYSYLLECASNILKYSGLSQLAPDLVTDCYTYIIDNQAKLDDKIQLGMIEPIAVRWMVMQMKWRGTKFKKEWIYTDALLVSLNEIISDINSSDKQTRLEDSLMSEVQDEEEILEIEKNHQDKINHIKVYVSQMPVDKQLLFQMIYEQGYDSSSKLAAHIGLSRTPSYRLMKALKTEIKQSFNKQ